MNTHKLRRTSIVSRALQVVIMLAGVCEGARAYSLCYNLTVDGTRCLDSAGTVYPSMSGEVAAAPAPGDVLPRTLTGDRSVIEAKPGLDSSASNAQQGVYNPKGTLIQDASGNPVQPSVVAAGGVTTAARPVFQGFDVDPTMSCLAPCEFADKACNANFSPANLSAIAQANKMFQMLGSAATASDACGKLAEASKILGMANLAYAAACKAAAWRCVSACEGVKVVAQEKLQACSGTTVAILACQEMPLAAYGAAQSNITLAETRFSFDVGMAMHGLANTIAAESAAKNCKKENANQNVCTVNPTFPGCNGSGAVDCSKPANEDQRKKCICDKNPRDPLCTGGLTQKPSVQGGGNVIAETNGLPKTPDLNGPPQFNTDLPLGDPSNKGGGDDKGPGGGGGRGLGSSSIAGQGPGGVPQGGGKGSSSFKTDFGKDPLGGGGGGGLLPLGANGDSDGKGGPNNAGRAPGSFVLPKGLKDFNPNKIVDPNGLIAVGPDGITSANGPGLFEKARIAYKRQRTKGGFYEQGQFMPQTPGIKTAMTRSNASVAASTAKPPPPAPVKAPTKKSVKKR